jgi:hypothetical protein
MHSVAVIIKHEAGTSSVCFWLGLLFYPEDGSDEFV